MEFGVGLKSKEIHIIETCGKLKLVYQNHVYQKKVTLFVILTMLPCTLNKKKKKLRHFQTNAGKKK